MIFVLYCSHLFVSLQRILEYRVGLHLWREGFKDIGTGPKSRVPPKVVYQRPYMRGVYHESGASRSLFLYIHYSINGSSMLLDVCKRLTLAHFTATRWSDIIKLKKKKLAKFGRLDKIYYLCKKYRTNSRQI